MRIVNNIMAMNAHRQLTINQAGIQKSIEKLSSGLRINRAGDDAAGLAISEKMRSQIRGLKMAQKNAQDAISLIQTAEGAMQELHAILQRMRELAVQAASDTNTDQDRQALQDEIDQLIEEIDRIATNTEFNTKKLLDGSLDATSGTALTIHIGANSGQSIQLSIANMSASSNALAVSEVNITTQAGANAAITTIDNAIEKVSTQRAKLGAYQNRLEHTIANLGVAIENLQAAESRVRDVDMAHEMMTFTKYQILQQASTAMLAQANLAPQSVLQLLG